MQPFEKYLLVDQGLRREGNGGSRNCPHGACVREDGAPLRWSLAEVLEIHRERRVAMPCIDGQAGSQVIPHLQRAGLGHALAGKADRGQAQPALGD